MALNKTNTDLQTKKNSQFEQEMKKINDANIQKREENRKSRVVVGTDRDQEKQKQRAAKEERLRRLLEKQMNRTIQRSMKIDTETEQWLNNVKEYKKRELGEVRPCLDDLYYDALREYLDNHFEELRP